MALLVTSAVAAFAVLLVGGYAGHWQWTGFTGKDNLWDWLKLLVLPAVLGSLPLWLGTRRRRRDQWRLLVAVVGITFAILIAGGYGWHWTWTGFQDNKLWDWLHLLVLPVVVTLIPLWLESRSRLRTEWQLAVGGVGAGLAVVVIGGYRFAWDWTGFPGNTLWDWIELLIVPLALPFVLAWLSTHRVEITDTGTVRAEGLDQRARTEQVGDRG